MIIKLKDELNKAENERSLTEKSLTQNKTAYDSLLSEKSSISAKVNELHVHKQLDEDKNTMSEKLQEKEVTEETLRQEIETLKVQNSKNEAKTKELEAKVAEVADKNKELKAKVSDLEKECEANKSTETCSCNCIVL